jgi:Patatin-like phospholipase
MSDIDHGRQAEGDEARVLADERRLIEKTRAARIGQDGAPWCGLGLSGGGIRSASLSLGVLQALAESDVLRRFDFISSVSGGGYIATSLQWWWGRPREDRSDPGTPIAVFGVGPSDFPYGPARPGAPPDHVAGQRGMDNLAFLRAHSSYLTAGNGLSFWSILGVLARTITISVLTWLPILTAFFVVVSIVGWGVDIVAHKIELWSPLGPLVKGRWTQRCAGDIQCDLTYPAIYALGLWLYYLLTAIFVLTAILFAFVSRAPQDHRSRLRTVALAGLGAALAAVAIVVIEYSYSTLDVLATVVILLLSLYVLVSALIVISEWITTKSLNPSYYIRRSMEWLLGVTFIPTVAVLAWSTIPLMPSYGWGNAAHVTLGGVVGLVSGVGSALYGYYTFLRNIVPGLVGQIVSTIAGIVYLYATCVVAYVLAAMLLHYKNLPIDWNVYLLIGLVTVIFIAFGIGFFANINYVGFHRFYRDRLMETFMPTDTSVTRMQATWSPVADDLSVADLRRYFEPAPSPEHWKPRPYPLINTNAILINDLNQKYASRGGDNFLISPLYIGSNATGWQDTIEYIDRNGPFTLASAMAASGAAANASAGYVGTGITMNPLVSAVMSLLNIRLGLYSGNPIHRAARRVRTIPTFMMAGFFPGLIGALHRRDSAFLELTDGGHFENLGIYELVRRKLDVIMIVDGEEDPKISLTALVSAARRIEQDFGARIALFQGRGPERLVMYPGEKGYPLDVRYAKAPFVVGEVIYNDGRRASLIYIKATLIKEIDFTTAGYLASNPTFPHQTTADQFFDPDQFDAYRSLGYESARHMIESLDLATTIATPTSIVTRYCTDVAADATT